MPWTARQLVLTIAICIAAWSIFALIGMSIGSGHGGWWPADPQVRMYRLQIVLVASLIGAALSAAGVVYQALLKNPLADPYLLGVSSGAALAGYLWRLTPLGDAFSAEVAAFIGALAAVAIVFAFAGMSGRFEPLTLLLVGVIVNAFNAAVFLLIDAVVRNLPGSGSAYVFLVGGIQTNVTAVQQLLAAGIVLICWIVLAALSGALNVAPLSDIEAESLGVRITRLRWIGLITASILTAAAVAISGPIGFVGLIGPHLGRLVVGNDVRKVLPVATAFGACLLILADAASRRISGVAEAQTLLPVGVLTSLLGGPFFLLVFWRWWRRSM